MNDKEIVKIAFDSDKKILEMAFNGDKEIFKIMLDKYALLISLLSSKGIISSQDIEILSLNEGDEGDD